MVKLGTYCNECIFCKDNQCKLGKLEKFKERGTEVVYDEDGPKVGRVCVYRRDAEWASNIADNHHWYALDEVYISGSIVVKARSIDGLRSTIDKLNVIPKIGNFLIIILHDESLSTKDVKECASNIALSEYQCIKTFLDGPEATNEAFRRCKNGYLFIIDSEKDFDPEMTKKVNHLVNDELFQILHIEPIDGNQSVTAAIVFKYFNGDIVKPIGEKIKEMGGESMVMTWEDVNEHYNWP